ncbi:hypothetical protein E4U40_000393 [Claviceps sp. LM458 group G5]|nr:hypothetical protein E4U40_000393 [Claviceps sp. LM458 group G5]
MKRISINTLRQMWTSTTESFGHTTIMFCEDFAYWSFETWETATAKVRQEMRDLLEEKGIPTAKGSGLSVSRDLKAIISDFINAKSIDIKSRQSDHMTKTDNGEDDNKQSKDDIAHLTIEQKERRAQEIMNNLEEQMRTLGERDAQRKRDTSNTGQRASQFDDDEFDVKQEGQRNRSVLEQIRKV